MCFVEHPNGQRTLQTIRDCKPTLDSGASQANFTLAYIRRATKSTLRNIRPPQCAISVTKPNSSKLRMKHGPNTETKRNEGSHSAVRGSPDPAHIPGPKVSHSCGFIPRDAETWQTNSR